MDERECSLKYWDERHSFYEKDKIKVDDWLDVFADIIDKCESPVLDLGCGSGNDTFYFLNKGKNVVSCDQSPNAIENIKRNFPNVLETRCFNFLDGFDFPEKNFEIVCADLCLHYFRLEDTRYIIEEIKKIMTDDGYLFLRVNSVKDILHGAGQGKEIEKHLYKLEDGTIKRFFDKDDIDNIFSDFDIIFCEEQPMNRYALKKIVYSVGLRKRKV